MYDIDEHLMELILKSEDVYVEQKDILFDGLEQWTSCNEVERRPFFCSLLPLVQLPIIPAKFSQLSFLQIITYKTDAIVQELLYTMHVLFDRRTTA